jgi:nucleoid DNA-binding protein
MIRNALNNVYKKDQKVFIPDFGLIFFSDATESALFNNLLTLDDGKLIHEIMDTGGVTEDKARQLLKEFLSEVKLTTESGKAYSLGDIGYFSLNSQNELTINEEDTHSGDTDKAYKKALSVTNDPNQSVSPVEKSIAPVEPMQTMHTEGEEEVSVIESQDLSDINEEKEPLYNIHLDALMEEEKELVEAYYQRKQKLETKTSRKPVAVFVSVLLLVLTVFSLYYFKNYDFDTQNISNWFTNNYNKLISEVDNGSEEKKTNIVEVHSVNESVQEVAEMASIPVTSTNYQAETPIVENIVEVKSNGGEPTVSDQLYRIVLGSFKIESNADNFIVDMNEKGVPLSKFNKEGFYFTIIENVKGYDEAARILSEVKKNHEPTAWMTKKK